MRRLALVSLLVAARAFAQPDDELTSGAKPVDASPPSAEQGVHVRETPKVAAQAPAAEESEWNQGAHFFGGVRMGVAIPPGGHGLAPSLGLELGVSAAHGIGFGLHLITMDNPPDVPALGIAKANWGLGALADIRMYFQSIDPLTLYATLSGGFVAGPGLSGTNVVLPMLNPGFGARVKITDVVYCAFEFGLAGFTMPFVTLSLGWEPERKHRKTEPVAG